MHLFSSTVRQARYHLSNAHTSEMPRMLFMLSAFAIFGKKTIMNLAHCSLVAFQGADRTLRIAMLSGIGGWDKGIVAFPQTLSHLLLQLYLLAFSPLYLTHLAP